MNTNTTIDDDDDDENEYTRELTWEERALAIERVPPAGIRAWGPTGDLGMDARTKAISDALEDICEAKLILADMEKRVEFAREDVSVLRVDGELEKRRLLNRGRQDPRKTRAEMRRIEGKIDDAVRALRYAQSQLKLAQQDLKELERRHWAVLRFYNPDRAGEGVKDALQELEENEPAVRRYREKASGAGQAKDMPSEGKNGLNTEKNP